MTRHTSVSTYMCHEKRDRESLNLDEKPPDDAVNETELRYVMTNLSESSLTMKAIRLRCVMNMNVKLTDREVHEIKVRLEMRSTSAKRIDDDEDRTNFRTHREADCGLHDFVSRGDDRGRDVDCVSGKVSSEVTKVPLAELRRLFVMESKLSECMER